MLPIASGEERQVTTGFGRVLVGKRVANEENRVPCLSDLLMSASGEA